MRAVFYKQTLLILTFILLSPVWGLDNDVKSVASVTPANKPIIIGVLSFRPKPQTLAQWKPLGTVLNQAIPEHEFTVEALTYSDLEAAVAQHRVDFVLTNPVNYILLQKHEGLSAPLATLAVKESGHTEKEFGGVIFARADQKNINSLEEIKGKTIAVTNKESMGGYQMQIYEFDQAGIRLGKETKFDITGMPHDNVVKSVLSGKADVGFVRSGVLEDMVREGKLDGKAFKIINHQIYPHFPVQVSTRLYPEWPLAALSGTDEKLSRHVTAALFELESSSPLAKTMEIDGFTLPVDYSSVEMMLRALHLPPFDHEPTLTVKEIWRNYHNQIVGILFILGLIGFITLIHLWNTHRRLKESEFKLSEILENVDAYIYLKDIHGKYIFANRPVRELFGVSMDEIAGKSDESFFDFQTVEQLQENDRQVLEEGKTLRAEEINRNLKDGKVSTFLSVKLPLYNHFGEIYALCGISTDITMRIEAEEKLQLAASVFIHAREGIAITDLNGTIIDVNTAFSTITGYSRDEVIGKNTRILSSGRQSKKFYADMWHSLIEQNYWYGEVWNRRKNGEVYAEMLTISAVHDAHGNIQHYVALFSDITQVKEHEGHLKHIAHYDVLTNMPNRVLLAEYLQEAMALSKRHGQPLAVAFLDLDGFKAINDTYGHEVGDNLLITVASNMKKALREEDILARFGGDEFVVVMMDQNDITSSYTILGRLLEAASEPIYINDRKLQVSASIGVTFYPQLGDVDADQLLRQADQAMYQAKLSGKNQYHFFDAELDRTIRGHHESIKEIQQALENNEFVLYYQPKVNMRTGKVIGFEALIRWQHPKKGLVPPAEFLPIIENHLLEIEVGKWVIDTALTQMELWHKSGADIKVSVNISANQLQEADFVKRLHQIVLAHPNVNPSNLQIELLETSELEDVVRTARIIEACKDIGVSFALDDFGTGYSSLTYLKQLPITLIKIDQSFVRDMLIDSNDLNILEGVISLAKAFHRQVIAEGVETVEHGILLLELGCELAQGYVIARPMPAHELLTWISSWKTFPEWK
ncbi:MAG TPA: EAL domain-containing protein [Sulfuricurvum sp.]|nr:EAL domain-containing protein [Sulfuricurvum sp.]